MILFLLFNLYMYFSNEQFCMDRTFIQNCALGLEVINKMDRTTAHEMQMRVWNVTHWILSNLADGHFESGLHFSINFFWGEVTGQKSSAQLTVKSATVVHALHTLLKVARVTKT